jgi:quercetin dioxygenase-like cupin family protein
MGVLSTWKNRGLMTGKVVRAEDVPADMSASGASILLVMAVAPPPGAGGPGLVRGLVEIPGGAGIEWATMDGAELWFVIAGSGRLDLAGEAGIALGPDQGLLLPQGSAYRVHADGPGVLRLDTVTLAGAAPIGGARSRQLADCDVEMTGDRQFRVLFGPAQGCPVATQFVGEIPPGRAPEHSHPYDELVLVLAGQGTAHIDGTGYPLAVGSYLHLPPGLSHCLENTGSATLRVLGVFHPADSPAAKLPPPAADGESAHGRIAT